MEEPRPEGEELRNEGAVAVIHVDFQQPQLSIRKKNLNGGKGTFPAYLTLGVHSFAKRKLSAPRNVLTLQRLFWTQLMRFAVMNLCFER